MKTLLITGADGFIARSVAAALAGDPVRLVGLAQFPGPYPVYARTVRGLLGQPMGPVLTEEKIDVVLHCANHVGPDEFATNVEGTRRWAREAAEHGATLQILLSSVSADEHALADYGRAKWALERTFLEMGGVILRLGMVIGNGGMFQKTREPLTRAPFIPLLDGGRQLVYVVGIDALTGVIRRCVLSDGTGLRGRILHAVQPDPVHLVDLLQAIRRRYGYRCRFVPMPSLPILWALQVAEAMPGFRFPISSTNVRGLRQSRDKRFPSDLAELGGTPLPLDELVARVPGSEK